MSDTNTPPEQIKKSKYASQIAYEKRRLATDPEYRKKKQDKTYECNKRRYHVDEEYRQKILAYQKQHRQEIKQAYQFVKKMMSEQTENEFANLMQSLKGQNINLG